MDKKLPKTIHFLCFLGHFPRINSVGCGEICATCSLLAPKKRLSPLFPPRSFLESYQKTLQPAGLEKALAGGYADTLLTRNYGML
jgi:hypothetical protein